MNLRQGDHVVKNVHELRKEFLQNLCGSMLLMRDPDEIEDIGIGSMVRIIDGSMYTHELLGIDEEDYIEFNKKVEAGEHAIVFTCDEDDLQWIANVFEDGLEVFNVNVLSLENIDITLEDL